MAGRVCLFKTVIMSSLIHSMRVYKWPISLIHKLDSALKNFVWSGDIMKKGHVTIAWARCCTPLEEGGLGLRSISKMNEAFMMRFAWDTYNNIVPFSNVFRLCFLNNQGHSRISY